MAASCPARLMTAQRRNPFMKSFTTPLAWPATSSDGGVIPSLYVTNWLGAISRSTDVTDKIYVRIYIVTS